MRVGNFFQQLDFIYEQRTGNFYLADGQDDRSLIARGYSGKGLWINDPSAEDKIAQGPLPRGLWRIHSPIDHPRLGPIALRLGYLRDGKEVPAPHLRSGFFIHGDNRLGNGTASSGCIILDRSARGWIAELVSLGANRLTVVS